MKNKFRDSNYHKQHEQEDNEIWAETMLVAKIAGLVVSVIILALIFKA